MAKLRKTVLLADASEEFRALLQDELERTGHFAVETAADGDRLLQMLQCGAPDFLILDAILPGTDGISVLRQLRLCGTLPCTILTSGFISDHLLAEASTLGAACFLPKPFRAESLLERMQAGFDANPPPMQPSLQAEVTAMLYELGMPAHYTGYRYIRTGILMAAQNAEVLHGITKILYPDVARRYGTTASRVERSIRHAVEAVWLRGDLQVLQDYFGHSVSWPKGKPTNSQFIATLAERLSTRQTALGMAQ